MGVVLVNGHALQDVLEGPGCSRPDRTRDERASSRCKPRTLGDSRSVSKLLYKVPWQLYVTVQNDNQDIRVNIGMVIADNGHIYR